MTSIAAVIISFLTSSNSVSMVDEIALTQMRTQKIPGMTVALLRDGKPVMMKGYGKSNIELNVAASPDTVYQSGSIGKQFTATLALMLAHEHVFSIDDPITKWFPEGIGNWAGVTIRHLMSHTSGLADIPYDKCDMRQDYSETDLVNLMVANPPVGPPGAHWQYNNGGYVLLGILIHRATGHFYGDLLQEKIFKPLGMSTARIISERDIVPNRASGYEISDKGLRNQAWVSPSLNTTADGALYLSVRDFAKWDAALYSDKLLPRTELEEAWTPGKLADGACAGAPKFGYGFGWVMPSNAGSHQLVEHGGAWQGFTTYIGRLLDQHLTVVVLTNLDSDHSKPTRIGRQMLNVFAHDIPIDDGYY